MSAIGSIGSSIPAATAVRAAPTSAPSESAPAITEQEKAEIEEMQETDAEVRRHEQAHLAAAGRYARGGATYRYQTGPDGRRYAVSGEVKIDTAEVPDDPAATLQKATVIKRAALAPSDPSAQDRRVAADADHMAAAARQEMRRENSAGTGYDGDGNKIAADAAEPNFSASV